MVRDDVTAALGGVSFIPNSVLRIMSDAKAGLAYMVLRYIDWLANQLLPDTAETEWLDRHGDIWLVNADGSTGRKAAAFSHGTATVTGISGTVIPVGTQLSAAVGINFETTDVVTIGTTDTTINVRALTAGIVGNLIPGDSLAFVDYSASIDDNNATVVDITGGTNEETDEQLRSRILHRIQNPPMGGDQADYVQWALAVPGVTRAWAYPEMGPGTITVRFLMDDLHSDNFGLPDSGDIAAVKAYLDTVRPVTVKDCFVQAPVPKFYTFTVYDLQQDTPSVRANIEKKIREMEYDKTAPGVTLWRAWIDDAVNNAVGEDHHGIIFNTPLNDGLPNDRSLPMTGMGLLPLMSSINYA
jgi:uncharacterized phage protein gp47/JayE